MCVCVRVCVCVCVWFGMDYWERVFPDSIEEERLVIKKKHQSFKKQLKIRRRKIWAKFK